MQQEGKESLKKVLAKVPKITTFLSRNEPTTATALSKSEGADPLEESEGNAKADTPATITTSEIGECCESHSHREMKGTNMIITDLAQWPEPIPKEMRLYWVVHGGEECQHSDGGFEASKTVDGDRQARYCSKRLFTFTHPLTHMQINRSWLCYSPTNGKVFCFPCKLFSEQNVFTKGGYNDWKNASVRFTNHERNPMHMGSIGKMNNLIHRKERVNASLEQQYET